MHVLAQRCGNSSPPYFHDALPCLGNIPPLIVLRVGARQPICPCNFDVSVLFEAYLCWCSFLCCATYQGDGDHSGIAIERKSASVHRRHRHHLRLPDAGTVLSFHARANRNLQGWLLSFIAITLHRVLWLTAFDQQ